MFIWIQKALFKNGKYLFGALLAIVIVAFVFTFTPAGGGAIGPSQSVELKFMGYDLTSPRKRQPFETGLLVDAYFNQYHFELNRSQESYTHFLLVYLAKYREAERLNIPRPAEEQVKDYIRQNPMFAGPDGKFNPQSWTQFTDGIRNQGSRGISEGMLARAIEDSIRLSKVDSVIGAPGYNVPYFSKLLTLADQVTRGTTVATLSYSDFQPEIEPTEEELKKYYEENTFRFETGDVIDLAAVVFPTSAVMDQVQEPTEEEAREYYELNQFRYVKLPEEGQAPTPNQEYRPFEEVRENIMAALRDRRANELAGQKASDFSLQLYRQNAQIGDEKFNELLTTYGAELKDLEPFSDINPPKTDLFRAGTLRSVADRLSADNRISDVQNIANGSAVIIFQDRKASTVQPYEEVASDVRAGYVAAKRKELFIAKGNELKDQIDASVKEGKTFAEAAEEAGLVVASYEDVSLRTPPEGFPRTLLAQLNSSELHTVSPFISSSRDGYIYYVDTLTVPELDQESDTYQRYADNLGVNFSRMSQAAVFTEVIEKEELR